MIVEHPGRLIIVGFFLVLVGLILPVLMLLGYVESTLLLGLLAYGASTSGLILGVIGTLTIVRIRKRKATRWDADRPDEMG